MPQLNFNLLAPSGPRNVFEGYMVGREQQNQLARQQQQQQMADLQLQNAMREQQQAEEESAAWRAGGGESQATLRELQQRGLAKPAMALQAQMVKMQADKMKQQKDQLDLVKGVANRVFSNPENAGGILSAFSRQTGIDISDDVAQIQQLGGTPDAAKKWAQGIAFEADKLLPKFQQFDQGGAVVTGTTDPTTGKFTPGTAFKKTMAPGEAERLQVSRGQLAVAQAGERRQASEAEQRDRVVAHTTTDEAGNVTLYNRFGQVIPATSAVGAAAQIKGKPSATFEKVRAQREQITKDLTLAIDELSKATADGGLIDQSTGSGAGRAVDVAAGFFGSATPGAIAIAKLKPISDLALKMIPRFEGPQSDKDTQSYKEAAGQLADPTLPNSIRKEAGKTVLRLMRARKHQFVTPEMDAAGVGSGAVDTNNPLLK